MTEVLRYLLAGGLNTLITFVIYGALVYCGLAYYFANMIAWVVGIICAYFYGLFFVFSRTQATRQPNFIQFAKFSLTYGVSFVMSSLALAALIESQFVTPLIAQCIVIPFVVVFNFLSSKFLIFQRAKR